ncbi:MAG: helix-turn-helix domain-containing protein [Eubacterium sp.]|nr:helix-turn-helix domain-containing protein [Eubacterium sp.]
MAEKTELSVQAISTAERGTKALRPDNLLKISRTLGVSADYLLSDETTEDNLRFSTIADKLKLLSDEQVQAVLALIDVMKK